MNAIGRLLRSSTTGFVFGCSVPQLEVPRFGDFVKAPTQKGEGEAVGLVYDIVIQDDHFVRQMVATPDLDEAYILDQRQNRQVPIEVSVLAVGYRNGKGKGHIIPGLPPQPPITLDGIDPCSEAEITSCTEGLHFLRFILCSTEVPSDELIIISLQRAAAARPPEERAQFLRLAGRELARLLSRDLPRLENLLRRIKP